MEVHNTKGGGIHYLAIMLCVMLMALLNAYCCGAAVLAKSNSSFQCDGRLEECPFELEELDLELLVNPYVTRMLKQPPDGTYITEKAVVSRSKPAVGPCSHPPYGSCLGDGSGKRGCRDVYAWARVGS